MMIWRIFDGWNIAQSRSSDVSRTILIQSPFCSSALKGNRRGCVAGLAPGAIGRAMSFSPTDCGCSQRQLADNILPGDLAAGICVRRRRSSSPPRRPSASRHPSERGFHLGRTPTGQRCHAMVSQPRRRARCGMHSGPTYANAVSPLCRNAHAKIVAYISRPCAISISAFTSSACARVYPPEGSSPSAPRRVTPPVGLIPLPIPIRQRQNMPAASEDRARKHSCPRPTSRLSGYASPHRFQRFSAGVSKTALV